MSNEKSIIFDASTLISLSMNGLLDELRNLKKIFQGHFIITNSVKAEVIDHPLEIKRFKLEALNTNSLLEDKTLEMPSILGVSENEIMEKSEELINQANSAFIQGNKTIHILDMGEISCVALSKILAEKGIKSLVAVDERTMRLMCERPENLRKLLEKKLHTKINFKKENSKEFQGIKIVRSSELIYFANKKDLTRLKGKKVLDALLYALKSKGCSVSFEEIEEMTK